MGILIRDHSEEVIAAKDAAAARALEAMGQQAEGNVKQLTPVDTGRLRSSITHAQLDEKTMAVGTNVEYAAYVELGTRKTAAQPYMRPGVENYADQYKSIAEMYLRS